MIDCFKLARFVGFQLKADSKKHVFSLTVKMKNETPFGSIPTTPE